MAGPTNARQHLREEPDALAAHVRICAGGPQQCGFLPRYPYLPPRRSTLRAGVASVGAEGVPWRGSRLIRVGESGRAAPGLGRAGRPRSREALFRHDCPSRGESAQPNWLDGRLESRFDHHVVPLRGVLSSLLFQTIATAGRWGSKAMPCECRARGPRRRTLPGPPAGGCRPF